MPKVDTEPQLIKISKIIKYNLQLQSRRTKTMASKYLQKYPVPAGFQQILADFTREVLRDQPPNIIQYASKYFEMLEKGDKLEFNSKFNVAKDDKKYELAYNPKNAEDLTKKATSIAAKVSDSGRPDNKKADPAPAKPTTKPAQPQQNSAPANVPPQILKQLKKVFATFDENGNGFIDSKQIRKAVEKVARESGWTEQLDQAQVTQFVKAVDENGDGRINVDEFVNFMAKLLAPMFQNVKFSSEKTVNQQEVENFMNEQGENAMYLELQAKFNEIFNKIDVDGSGQITSNEIHRIAQMFSEQTGEEVDENEIAEFVSQVDTNNDGKISKEELFEFFMSLMGQ